jgi:hypothetical protein
MIAWFKRLGVLSLAGLVLVPTASAGAATLGQRVAKLERQVKALKAENDCLVRYGMSEWIGYVMDDGEGGTLIGPAANFDAAIDESLPPDVWVVASKPAGSCVRKFSKGPNPYAGLAARPNGVQIEHLRRLVQ